MWKKKVLILTSSKDVDEIISRCNKIAEKLDFSVKTSHNNFSVKTAHGDETLLSQYDLAVMINYDQIVKLGRWVNGDDLPKDGLLNIHTGSVRLAGSNPWFWSIVNRENSGVVVHKVTSNNIDSGEIVWAFSIPEVGFETGQELRERTLSHALTAMETVLGMYSISGTIPQLSKDDEWESDPTKVREMKKMFNLSDALYDADLDQFINVLFAASRRDFDVKNCYFEKEGYRYYVNLQIKKEKQPE